MDDHSHPRSKAAKADFAAQMARAEFGRFYVDASRIEQTLKNGEIVFQHKGARRRARPD